MREIVMSEKKPALKSASFQSKINKNDISVSIRQRRIDIMKNGNWIGKTYWYGNFEFNPYLGPEEYTWVERKLQSHFN